MTMPTGEEVASFILNHNIQSALGEVQKFSEADIQHVYNSLHGRVAEQQAFNKWMKLEDIILLLAMISNNAALFAVHCLNVLTTKLRALRERPTDNKKPIKDELKFIHGLYHGVIKNLRDYNACLTLCEIIGEHILTKLKPLITGYHDMLESVMPLFNMECDSYFYLQYVAKKHSGVKPPLSGKLKIDCIRLKYYKPSPEVVAQAKSIIKAATADDFLKKWSEALKIMMEG